MSLLSPAVDGPPQASPSSVECRVWERFPCEVKASCQPVAARNDRDLHWPATLKDVSAKGAGVILGRRFERGAGLAIELAETATRPADTLLARVVHVCSLPDGRWLHGCSLISELGSDELDGIVNLGQAQTPAAPQDHVIPQVLFRWLDGGLGREPFHARRLFLKGSWPLQAGTILRVRRGDAPEAWLRVKVQSCAQQQGRWVVACRVVGRPAPGVLRSLTS